MKHVVIGANGFLGRTLVQQLTEKGERVLALDLAGVADLRLAALSGDVTYTQADIAAPGALESIDLGPGDVIHHLASKLIIPNKPRFGRYEYFASCSVTGTKHILRWMENAGGRHLVFWSTDMVYGPALYTPRTETHPLQPNGPYGRTKIIGENLVRNASAWGLSATILRPRLIIGRDRLGILKVLFDLIRRGQPVPLIGDGSNRFQFVSVDDCARASILATERGCPSVTLNLGSAEPPTVHALLTSLIENAGSKSRLIRTPGGLVQLAMEALNFVKMSPMDPEQFRIADQDVTLDIGAAKKVLGWAPTEGDADMLFAAYQSYIESLGAAS